jgi:hypothetical protein
MTKIKGLSCRKRFRNFIKGIDSFGAPVSLTYKRESNIKSVFGGVISIVVRLAVIGYFIVQLQSVLNQNYTI